MSSVISIVYFTRILPARIADELGYRGIMCYEAFAISEVLNLCEQPDINLVVIDPSVDDERACIVQQKFPTLRIGSEAKVNDVLWEITNLLGNTSLVQ